MIDPKLLREEFDSVIRKLETRNCPADIGQWPALDEQHRKLLHEIETIRATKNKIGPDIAKAKKEKKDVSALLDELKTIGEREKVLQLQISDITEQLKGIELLIPNIPHDTVPVGKGEEQNRVEKEWGDRRNFTFKPKPHWEVGEDLGILDFETASKISGARFALYRGAGARLERALINLMLERHAQHGYTEIIPPLLVREETMLGSAQLPKFEQEAFKTAEFDPKLYLIPTSEVVLVNLHAGEILEEERLPLYYTSYTPCFRAEAGSHGRDVRGLIRNHQFNKVELVKVTTQESSYAELDKLTADAESILELLKLPYRRVTLSTGDMGFAGAKTFDLEVWLPGMNSYREISSCSNTTDFQSRRTGTRYRKSKGDKPQFVHLLNGSGLAIGRTVVAILENYQEADGTVIIPDALRPFMNGQVRIEKH